MILIAVKNIKNKTLACLKAITWNEATHPRLQLPLFLQHKVLLHPVDGFSGQKMKSDSDSLAPPELR